MYGQTDSDFEISQHHYIQLMIPELQVYENSFNENEIDFKIDFIDLRKSHGAGEWHGLGPFYVVSINPHDVDKHDLETRIIHSILKDSTGNMINSTDYKLISTGENNFETDGKVKDQVYIQWYKDGGIWESYSDADKKSLMYEPDIYRKEIIPVEPIDAEDFHHRLYNKHVFPDVRYTVEGKIQSELFIPEEKYTFEVYSSSSDIDSITFEIPKKEIILENDSDENPEEKILTKEEIEQRSGQFANDLEEQQRLQQEKALKEYEERKNLEESEIIEDPVITPEQINSQDYVVPEAVVDPEPVESYPKCGPGTEIVDGYCKVLKPSKNEDNFFDFVFKIFSDLFLVNSNN